MASVLIVDDSRADRRLADALLDKDGAITTAFAESGRDALEKMKGSLPDLVVTDLVMPEMDGLELVETVHKTYPLVPIILMTSRGSEETAVQALRKGAASYVPKRNLAHDLLDTVKRVLAMAGERRNLERVKGYLVESRHSFLLGTDPTLIAPLVLFLQERAVETLDMDEGELLQTGVALEEALINALHHGNLELDSRLRDEDYHAYFALFDERKATSPYRERKIQVNAIVSPESVSVTIRDEGPGFDPTDVPDPTDPSNIERGHGRGMLLMRTFMTEVAYNERGNEVTLVKVPSQRDSAASAVRGT